MPKLPTLGSEALQAPSEPPHLVRITPSLCNDLSLFKDLLKEYRRLDDAIVMRLNRTNAQFRDRERKGTAGKGNLQDQSCVHMWKELVESWRRRTELIDYCDKVVEAAMEEKREAMKSQPEDAVTLKKIQAALYHDQVKRNQVHNELGVERIIRQRTMDAFRSRCKYFEPPTSGLEQDLWDSAQPGRS